VTSVLGKSIGPIFKGQEIQKREQSMPEINWHNFFWGGGVGDALSII